ncbi:NAD(P)-binding protein [Massarina eburnea CBS 473.64]|uniref:NAD(P)-binding protein n=1 Tax=Massarina eburnea CBS 473.64 TaxID=1395130 RepID=A0A6A6RFH0_9PLEO|nr:NAD(P)-binding protein [Massarina eburnea CBS 473.64]
MSGPFQTTADGIELQFGGNHVGHFLFTNLIIPKILASKAPRIVNVSSNGHKLGPVRFEDPNFKDGKEYNQWWGYGQSKTANILFSKSLAQKLGSKNLTAFSLHPGVIMGTSLAPSGLDIDELTKRAQEVGWTDLTFDEKNPDEGTATHVVAAFDPRLNEFNGAYLENANISDDVAPWATDLEQAEKLWKLSEKLVGQTFQY